MLQFSWRRATEDVDALVRQGYDEAVLAASVSRVAETMGFDPGWLNDAVGMFTPLDEDETLFEVSGSYPSGRPPGLRTFLAKPRYLLAMKLQVLQSLDRGDRDMTDARALARDLGIADEETLFSLYRSIYDEEPPPQARARFKAVLDGPSA